MGDVRAVADNFVKYYYETFNTNRANLAALFQQDSTFVFEGQQFQGPAAIAEKLNVCKHLCLMGM